MSYDRSSSESPDALHDAPAPGTSAKDIAAEEQWRDQCRRQMERPLALRLKYGFSYVHKPVLDDAPWRTFATTAEYRRWCADNLPEYLGFKPASP